MQERPFLLLGNHALQAVADRLQNALQAWASQWCPGEHDYTVSATSARPPLQAPTLQRFSDGTADLWISTSDARTHATARCVLGEGWMASQGVPGDWSCNVVSHALESQSQAVSESLLLGQVQPVDVVQTLPTSLFALGSGAVSLDCATLGLRLWASRHVLRHVPPRPSAQPKSPLQPLAACLGGRTVPVTAVAGTVKLAAEQLLDLATGDVLRIGTLADAKAQIRLSSGLPLAEGTLGQQAGKRALRLEDRTTPH